MTKLSGWLRHCEDTLQLQILQILASHAKFLRNEIVN